MNGNYVVKSTFLCCLISGSLKRLDFSRRHFYLIEGDIFLWLRFHLVMYLWRCMNYIVPQIECCYSRELGRHFCLNNFSPLMLFIMSHAVFGVQRRCVKGLGWHFSPLCFLPQIISGVLKLDNCSLIQHTISICSDSSFLNIESSKFNCWLLFCMCIVAFKQFKRNYLMHFWICFFQLVNEVRIFRILIFLIIYCSA